MVPWELVDSAHVPGSGQLLRLYKRGVEFSIRVGSHELMNSRVHGSEESLADLACLRIAKRARSRILIAGLGMGYSVAAALRRLATDARVSVIELVPAVVAWNRGALAHLAGNPLADQRVRVREADIVALLKTEQQQYDAILFDVDNGPQGLTRTDNSWLYTPAGLKAGFGALRPQGVLAVWSALPDRAFAQRLRRTGFTVDEVTVRARGRQGGSRRTIWIAQHVV
ncbi:MAG: hypothetical protein HY270_14290 [Deltaproteobacteria bacterium]|nr:hypothetical protein [Deltaproteobacteria bacterium]